jgi:AraC-like DNA-binding protein
MVSVEAVKQQLQDGANVNRTIMSLAYDAGFNCKATFNRAFKKQQSKAQRNFWVAIVKYLRQ